MGWLNDMLGGGGAATPVAAQPAVGLLGQTLDPEKEKWNKIGQMLMSVGGGLAQGNARGLRLGDSLGFAAQNWQQQQQQQKQQDLQDLLLGSKIDEARQKQAQRQALAQAMGIPLPGSTPAGSPTAGPTVPGQPGGMLSGAPGVGGAAPPAVGMLASLPPDVQQVVRLQMLAGDTEGAFKTIQLANDHNKDVIWDPKTNAYVPNQTLVNAKGQIAAAGRPVTNVQINAENESAKVAAQNAAKYYSELQSGAAGIPIKQANWDQLNALLDQVNTGQFAGTMVDLKAKLKGLGIDPNSLGVKDDVAPAQAAAALSNQMALQMRSTANGAGMPGAMSDKDREFLQQMIPNINMTTEGRKLLSEFQTRQNQFVAGQAKAVNDFVAQNKGVADYRVYEIARKYAEEHPIFTEADRQRVAAMNTPQTPQTPQAPQAGAPKPPTQVLRFDAQGRLIQ